MENDLLTRVDPKTPTGRTLRANWLPTLLAAEIPEPDCPPERVHLAGEQSVAFRDALGRIGLLDELPRIAGISVFVRNKECCDASSILARLMFPGGDDLISDATV